MDFEIPAETRARLADLDRFIASEIRPLEEEDDNIRFFDHRREASRTLFDQDGIPNPEWEDLLGEARRRADAAGWWRLGLPEAIGGSGATNLEIALIREHLTRMGLGLHNDLQNEFSVVANMMTVELLHEFGSPAQQEEIVEKLIVGDYTVAFGLTEPQHGSDAAYMETAARRDGDEWVLTGTKQWITNSPYADYAMVFALTDPEAAARHKGGVTGFFVDTRASGFSVPRIINTMGHLGGDTGVIVLDGVRVRDDHRLGDVGHGLAVAMDGVNAGRMGMAASCLGLARWALDLAVDYAKVRKTFGVPIAEHQAIQLMLADSAMDIYAAKTMIQNCAWRLDSGRSANAQVSMVKAFSTEMLGRVMDRSIQIHGGMGLTNELCLEEGYRFARVMRIPDGTGEIQRRTVARQLLTGQAAL